MGLFGKKRSGARGDMQRAKVTGGQTAYSHPALGEITVVHNARARRISVSVRPPGRVRLTLPLSVPAAEGMRFLDSKRKWIETALGRIQKRSAADTPIMLPYSTRRHTLDLRTADIDRIRVRVGDGRISVTHPAAADPADEYVQNAIKRGIEEAWRIEARELLPRRVAVLADEHGFRYGNVAVRNTVSKWGSCTARGDLSLSLHLMRLPDHLIDYIILHELCHTVHHDHGAGFHALLDRHTGGRHLALRRELRDYHTRW